MSGFWSDSPELGARLDRVLDIIDASLRAPGFPLTDPVSAIARANGKLLRPSLLIIGSRFGPKGRGDGEARIDRLAAAVELLHIATLIHDDIIDEADFRRGVPTIHTSHGAKEAVLAGDWLFSRCFSLASESAGPGNAGELARLVSAICVAEIGQDLGRRGYSTSIRRYYRTIAGKTAALFSLALHAGAAEAKAPPRVATTLRRAGYDIGMAFQVIDDILDYESSEGVVRKPVGRDLAEGLCTLPLIYALRAEHALPAAEQGLSELLGALSVERQESSSSAGEASEKAIAAIISRVATLGGLARSREAARRFTARAQAEIARLPELPARDELASLAARLLTREY